ncbi:histone-lysine N-methyltransferase ASHH2 isoform X2 [Euphorbia lathyris]|uniref:histone-lysine N-methyltransferase ASHH2 isoform X2 n=1 Tax=Euphorbia lathyris TaxID=212925 RepID=UPI0033144891
MDVKIDALAVMESDLCTQIPSNSIEMLKELSITDFTICGCESQKYENNDNGANCLPVVRAPTDTSKESEVENYIQPCPSQPCLKTSQTSPTDDSLGICSQENERRDDKSVSSPLQEGASGVVEEESDVTTEIKVQINDQKLCVEGIPYDLKEDSPEIPPNSVELCWPCDTTENSSSGQLDALHPFGKAVFGGVSFSSVAESYEQKDNEGKGLAGNNSPPKSRCPNNGPSSSRRNNRIHKSSHKTQTKRASRKCKNKAKVHDLDIFTAERRRRTCSSKQARSSNWGLLGNIEKFFEHSNGLGHNEIQNYEPSKRNLGQESRKPNKSRDSGSTQGSSEKKNTSTSGIRLKVKLGKEVCQKIIVPEVFDTSAFPAVNDFETKSHASFRVPSFVNGFEDKMGADGIDRQLQCFDNKLEEAKVHSDTSISDLHLADKDLKGTVISQKLTGDAAGDCFGLPSHIEVEESVAVIQKRYIDPGTSPDSEVINLVPDSQVNTRSSENFPDAVLPSKVFVPGVISSIKRGKKKDFVSHASDCFPGDIFPQFACADKAKTKKKQGSKESKDDGIFSSIASSNSSCREDLSEELSHLSSKNDIIVPREAFQEENKHCVGLDAGHNLLEPQCSNHLLPSKKPKGSRLPKKSCEAKGRSKVSDRTINSIENGCRQRVKEHKSVKKNKVKEKNDCGDDNCKTEDDKRTGSGILDDIAKSNSDNNIAAIEAPNLDIASGNIAEQHIPVDNAWVSCDDCHKWRRIPVALVDSIGQTNCQWICKDNTDKAFADCSISQEKSNAEINAELGISDADEDAYDAPSKSKGLECFISNEHEFTRISANQFLHRSRKTQTIDEIMVCHCKLPLDGGLGCGDECLNRMLNIECVQGTCPCGDLCSNQQFQKRNYVKMKWDRCGKKGFGLRLEEDIPKGHFLIEYVGEVLDMHTYEARQKEYAFNSHKHFYFMTLNGSEVIDACAKGNLGRFINHSCDPNCRTEKWVVNGEICIGLFALRDIKKDEEVTFDYNYVRVFGAAAKKCYCSSSNCRGYIGGDPTSIEVIDQVDSDEEFLEPVMLEDGQTGYTLRNGISRSSLFNDELRVAEISKDKNKMEYPKEAEVKLEVASEIDDTINQSASAVSRSLESDDLKANFPSSCQSVEISETLDDITDKSVAGKHEISMEDSEKCEISSMTMLSKPSSDSTITKLKSKSSTVEEKRVFVKSRFLIKASRESCSFKKGKVTNNHLNASKLPMLANKSQILSVKPKKSMNGTNGRFEAVEEKLNELLDVDGGISKRKDAGKSYLKFLVHTAASGASGNGEAIQSNRDLSMILDALLKTKSRVVLIDIINKNGLRMLHNMIKQYRKDFKKTPILRKLLKVLEYLVVREILTQEHINGGPPCPGMESFKDSILSLTEHDDKQVHQIARNFRDRWIPRHGRRHGNMDREDGRMDFNKGSTSNRLQNNHLRDVAVRPAEAIDCAVQPNPATPAVSEGCSGSCASGGTKRRKRKSRWDQPAEEKPSSTSLQYDEQKIQSGLQQQFEYNPRPDAGKDVLDHVEKGIRESYCPHCARNYCRQGVTSFTDTTRQNIQSDVPPGFSPILVSPGASSTIMNLPEQTDGLKFPAGMVVGYPQKKFNSRVSVSYGIPVPIMQQFGSPQNGTKDSWAVAPGMPFHPFPPLPPFPTHKKESGISPPVSSTVIDETRENNELRHDNNPSTTGSNQPDMEIPGEDEQQSLKRGRASQDLGRRYFRQQKWNKVPPPWIRNRDGWGYLGNNSRGGICSNVGNVTYEERNSLCSQEVSYRVEKTGNCVNQQNSTLN